LLSYDADRSLLVAPYIWVWLLCERSTDNTLRKIAFGCYEEQAHLLGNPEKGLQTWEAFETFVARFRALKSAVQLDSPVPWSQLHRGAHFGPGCDVLVQQRPLTVRWAHKQRPTKSTDADFKTPLPVADGFITLSACDDVVICKAGNSGGDTVLGIRLADNTVVSEVIQDKLVQAGITPDRLKKEYDKSAEKDRDFFILFCSGPGAECIALLGNRCALVEASNFGAYFGPMAGRAFFLITKPAPNINTATRLELEAIAGIGEKTVDRIMTLRSTGKRFVSSQDVIDTLKPDRVPNHQSLNALRYGDDHLPLPPQ
jgi:hypothetical protein